MRAIKLSLAIAVNLISMNAWCAVTTVVFPFQNIQLSPNNTLITTYTFNSHPLIFCWINESQGLVNVEWPFQGVAQTSTLPITLKTSSIFTGFFADNSGYISVYNNTSSVQTINCQYAF